MPGVPVAAVLARGRARSAASLAVQGTFLGLAAALAIGLAAAHTVGISRGSVGIPLAVLALAAWPAAWRWYGRRLPVPHFTWPGAATAALLALALALRLDPVYFLAQSADFGEYVNRANVVADGGPFGTWFFQLFTIALALTKLVLGEAASVDLVPFLGMLLVSGLLAIGFELRFGPVVRLLVAVALTLHVVPVWFAVLPTSEALYAALLVGIVLFLLLAVQRGHHAEAVVAGGLVGLETVTRGNALFLLPVLVGGVVLGALLVERRRARPLASFAAVAVLTTFAGFVYNAKFSYDYFVPYQLPMYVPEDVALELGTVTRPGRLLIGLAVAIVGAVAAVAAVEGANRLGRLDRPGAQVLRRLAVPAVLAACLGGVVFFGAEVVAHALRNYGPVLGGAALVGVVALLVRTPRTHAAANAVLAPVLVVGAAFLVLHAYRLRIPKPAPTYLYWDRYLYSEVFPMLVIASFWGFALVVAAHRRLRHRLGDRAWAGTAAFGVVGVLALGQLVASTDLLRERRFFDGYYDTLAVLDDLTGPADEPIVYVGLPELPDYWFHPNTHRLVALPLAETFGRQVLNAGQEPFAPDLVPTWEEVAQTLGVVGADGGYAIVARGGGEQVSLAGADGGVPAGMAVQEVGVVELDLPVLDEPLDTSARQWRTFELDLAVLRVTLSPAPPEVVAATG